MNGQNNVGPNTIEPINGKIEYIKFEILTAVIMRSSIFWNITSCCQMKVVGGSGGTFRLYLQVKRMRQAKKQYEVGSKLCSTWLTFKELYSVIS